MCSPERIRTTVATDVVSSSSEEASTRRLDRFYNIISTKNLYNIISKNL